MKDFLLIEWVITSPSLAVFNGLAGGNFGSLLITLISAPAVLKATMVQSVISHFASSSSGHSLLMLLSNSATTLPRLLLLFTLLYALLARDYILKKKAFYLFCSYVTIPLIALFLETNQPYYPSLRTLEVFLFAFAFAFGFKINILSLLMFIWACLVAYASLTLSSHFLSDILFSVIIALFIALFWFWALLNPTYSHMHEL